MTTGESSYWNGIASWALFALPALLAVGCAGGQSTQTPDGTPDNSKPDGAETRPSFADDALGVARKWVHGLPESTDEAWIRQLADEWDEPAVARMVRGPDGTYTVIVADAARQKGDAISLRLEKSDGGWDVVGAETASATAFWPTTE